MSRVSVREFILSCFVAKEQCVPKNRNRQAGTDLCQAQEKLGLAKPNLPSKKLTLRSLPLTMKLGCLLFANKLMSSSVYL